LYVHSETDCTLSIHSCFTSFKMTAAQPPPYYTPPQQSYPALQKEYPQSTQEYPPPYPQHMNICHNNKWKHKFPRSRFMQNHEQTGIKEYINTNKKKAQLTAIKDRLVNQLKFLWAVNQISTYWMLSNFASTAQSSSL